MKDVQAYNATLEEDDDEYLSRFKKPGRDATSVNGVGYEIRSELKGVAEERKLKELEQILRAEGLEAMSKLVQEDQEDQYAFSRMKLNVSEPDFVEFIRGHYTME